MRNCINYVKHLRVSIVIFWFNIQQLVLHHDLVLVGYTSAKKKHISVLGLVFVQSEVRSSFYNKHQIICSDVIILTIDMQTLRCLQPCAIKNTLYLHTYLQLAKENRNIKMSRWAVCNRKTSEQEILELKLQVYELCFSKQQYRD